MDQFGQAQAPGQGGRKDQPGIGHQAVIVEGDADAIGVAWRGSIYWVLLFWGRFSVSKPLSQKHGSTFLPLQDADPTPSFGGFGLRTRGGSAPPHKWSHHGFSLSVAVAAAVAAVAVAVVVAAKRDFSQGCPSFQFLLPDMLNSCSITLSESAWTRLLRFVSSSRDNPPSILVYFNCKFTMRS